MPKSSSSGSEISIHGSESRGSRGKNGPLSEDADQNQLDIDALRMAEQLRLLDLDFTGAALSEGHSRSGVKPMQDLSDNTVGSRSVSTTSTAPQPELILQLSSSPISSRQLRTEMNMIYAILVRVEAQCITLDADLVDRDSRVKFKTKHWQGLIGLHQTLLHAHYDFLMAAQYPSADPSLSGLVRQHDMPARMWRHGIYSLLEVLRLADLQEYLLGFIYETYQLVATLFETVPMFSDTWMECLGDLARYRAAIEQDKDHRSHWKGVAGRWYNFVSDRYPHTGRLYHHLGMLERPNMQKVFLYTKSLICVVPFPNAQESLTTLYTPIVQDRRKYNVDDDSAEAGIVTFLAMSFLHKDTAEKLEAAGSEALSCLSRHPTIKVQEFAVELVMSAVGAILQHGSPRNWLWQRFSRATSEDFQSTRPSTKVPVFPTATGRKDEMQPSALPTTYASSNILEFCYSAFGTLLDLGQDQSSVRDILPSVHIMLSWLYSLHLLESWMETDPERDNFAFFLNADTFPWDRLSRFLNLTISFEPISADTADRAEQRLWLNLERREDARPLPEDYKARGLIWNCSFWPPERFSKNTEDAEAAIADPDTLDTRLDRVHWLALYMASWSKYLAFDPGSPSFSVPSDRSSNRARGGSLSWSDHSACSNEDEYVVIQR